MQKYIECIRLSQVEYATQVKEATADALKFLDIEEKCYDQSFILARANPDILEQLHVREEEVRMQIDRERDHKLTKDQIREIYIEKLNLDMETDMRLAEVRVKTEEQASQLVMVSRTETMDILYLKHGIKMSDLVRAVAEHSLNEDEEVIKLIASNEVAKDKMIEQLSE